MKFNFKEEGKQISALCRLNSNYVDVIQYGLILQG